MTYKRHEIIQSRSRHAVTGKPLYRVEGEHSKSAETRPLLMSRRDAMEWINEQIERAA